MSSSISLFSTYSNVNMEALATDVLRSGQIASGSFVKQFTEGFGKLIGNPNVVTLNDMSSAIQIALHLSDVKKGDEVLTTAFACMSTNAPISTAGANPVWVDVDSETGLMDPNSLRKAITAKTKAVIVYHVAGYPAKIKEIAEICREFGLKLIEDCNNALLASVNGELVGSFGDFAIYSFYPNRQINALEGGALVCRDTKDVERAVRLRRFGIDLNKFRDRDGEIDPNCDIPEIGWSAMLNNLNSAMGYLQLSMVGERISKTRENVSLLIEKLKNIDELKIVAPNSDCIPAYWVMLLRLKNRDKVLRKLKEKNINVSKLHHRTDLYSGFGTESAYLPSTRQFTDEVLALPCGWWLSSSQIETITFELKLILMSAELG